MTAFLAALFLQTGLCFKNYDELHAWSVAALVELLGQRRLLAFDSILAAQRANKPGLIMSLMPSAFSSASDEKIRNRVGNVNPAEFQICDAIFFADELRPGAG
jgi:hypothetical protein